MERRGKEDVIHRIRRIEIPTVSVGDGNWEKLADQWKWGGLGDCLRKLAEEDKSIG